jgi:hypothetical protein
VAIDEFCKRLARANPGALAQWLFDISGVGELAGGEFLGVGDDFADGPAATTAAAASAGDSSLVASAGSIAPAFYWQLIDTELAAESHRADTVILQAAPAALVAERVAAIRNPVLQKEIAGGCHLLAGLVFSQELINAYFTMGILDDSVTYQAAVAEYTRRGRLEGLAEGERHGEQRGHQLGHQQGLSQGRHQGLKEGELQGKQQEAQALVLRQLPRRCGQLSQSQELAVRALSLEQLEALAEALLDFDGPEALDAWLAV